ncbi:hypothetical protein DM793_18540 [Paenarthrobacter nitroguajacolicus]|uniref:hypothetical protein n=1 Tax=Paenarthrobacter nitroguajacolicus TaxID=211146 RepID=UPI0015BE5F79|nr:hypothetical protein [Paenarthrobacter nitroguajacolicus]NWL13266.1 hypothetical protein [Paenarthrobacter nitroguajacolicus]
MTGAAGLPEHLAAKSRNPLQVGLATILATKDHVHVFGRGSNGYCRECGAESKASMKRRLRRQNRASRTEFLDLHTALMAKTGIDHEGNAQ